MLTDIQRRVRLILQDRLNNTDIAKLTHCSRNTVANWRKALQDLHIDQEAFDTMDDLDIRQLITPGSFARTQSFVQPDFARIASEISNRGVEIKTLYDEYIGKVPPDEVGMSRSTFYRGVDEYRDNNEVTLSFEYEPGEMIQADFVGRKTQKQPLLIDCDVNVRNYEIFCAVSAKSRKIFVLAIESQTKLHALQAFVAMLDFFGGVPVIVTIDNFPAAVSTPRRGRQDEIITPEFQELADHFGFGLKATRVRKPRDKALVENGVGISQNDVLAPLRDRRFFSLGEMNTAIRALLDELNARPMKGHGGKSRNELFEESDLAGYRPLPSQPYEPGQWLMRVRAGRDYHVPVLGNRYSVPSRLANQQVNVKVTTTTVHLSYLGRLVATHVRSQEVGRLVTEADHMPPAHRSASMTRLAGIKTHVQDIGPDTVRFIEAHFRSVRNPSDTANAAAKIRALADQHTSERVEVACGRALLIGKRSVQTIETILVSGLDAMPMENREEPETPPAQANVRGASYFSTAMNAKDGGRKNV
nr:IS21 family transposase [uncultured Celeribacter sp.]